MTFTATGTGDACANPAAYASAGWQVSGVYFRVDYATRVHVLYPSSCNNPRYRPHSLVIACGDGGSTSPASAGSDGLTEAPPALGQDI